MKTMSSNEVRQKFLDYFKMNNHEIVSASSLVPGNDPTLLFTNAGMVQFKDVFLGFDKRPYTRAASSQKCMRISGKHNDLENVGPSPRHHTFFEMLGNFSFGDYFKKEAIHFGYSLLTEVFCLPAERLAFTVYATDDEAYNIWTKDIGVDPSRVARMGPKTNFWQMAETGPCGPTTEIHWDKRPELGEEGIIASLVAEDDRFLELWNLVFMQFNRTQPDPEHTGAFDVALPATGVDTGMGFERIVAVMQGVESNYDTDLFLDIMDATQKYLGHDDDFRQKNYVAYRVIADHTRAASFLIADGVNPGTTGREYICRMLIRRAWRFAHKMGVDKPFLVAVADAVIKKMSPVYPELSQFREAIRYQISTEEGRFIRTLDVSLSELETQIVNMKRNGLTVMPGASAFTLYATHGLPLEITRDLLQERGMTVDEPGFMEAMEAHRQASGEIRDEFDDVTVYKNLLDDLISMNLINQDGVINDPYRYEDLTSASPLLAIIHQGRRVNTASKGDKVDLLVERTPFYVEAGGQVSDTGYFKAQTGRGLIINATRPIGGLILHSAVIDEGAISVDNDIELFVDTDRRWDIMRNHTATHLLHAALRHVLGEHVRQKGSLVAPDELRFDFSHNSRMTEDELTRVAHFVDKLILECLPVMIDFKSLDEAKREGAMALFGEKYASTVRTITIPEEDGEKASYELCGGTHVTNTGQIGPFIIMKEESSSAGVRRITAITGRRAHEVTAQRFKLLDSASRALGTDPDSLLLAIQTLQEDLKAVRQSLNQLSYGTAEAVVKALLDKAKDIDGTVIITSVVAVQDEEMLGWMADKTRELIESGAVVLGAEIDGKARLVAKVSQDLIKRSIKAGEIIKTIAPLVSGGGGGRPDFATAGGKDPSGLNAAIEKAHSLIVGLL